MRVNFFKDPEAFAETVGTRPRKHLVLALDLATNSGYSYSLYEPGTPITSRLIEPIHMGQWDLSAGPYDSGAIRFVRLRQFLTILKPDLVVYEDVKVEPAGLNKAPNVHAVIARIATAAEFIGALRATVATWCEEQGVPCSGFGIGVIKKRATGRGNANKEMMIAACNEMFGSALEPEGYETTGVDNIADSAFCLLLGLEQYAGGLKPVPEE